MRRFVSVCLSIVCALVVSSCEGPHPHYVDYFPYHDSGAPKPAVAFVPTINRLPCEATPWDFAEEVSAEMRYQVMDDGLLFLIAPQQLDPALARVGKVDLMGNDISYSKQFEPCDFLVVTELLEHKYVPYQADSMPTVHSTHGHYCEKVLTMKVRLRIIDLRGATPCVILQEIVESHHMIGPDADKFNNDRLAWRTANYRGSPLSVAHQRLAHEVVARVEAAACTAR